MKKQTPIDNILNSLSSTSKDDNTYVDDEDYENLNKNLKKEEYRNAKLKNDAIEGENFGDTQDRLQRKEFAENIFKFTCYYMGFVIFIILLCGSPNSFNLSDTVLVTLLGTTTANVIGVLIIVVTYLFSRKKR